MGNEKKRSAKTGWDWKHKKNHSRVAGTNGRIVVRPNEALWPIDLRTAFSFLTCFLTRRRLLKTSRRSFFPSFLPACLPAWHLSPLLIFFSVFSSLCYVFCLQKNKNKNCCTTSLFRIIFLVLWLILPRCAACKKVFQGRLPRERQSTVHLAFGKSQLGFRRWNKRSVDFFCPKFGITFLGLLLACLPILFGNVDQ